MLSLPQGAPGQLGWGEPGDRGLAAALPGGPKLSDRRADQRRGGRRWGFEITAVADDGGPGGDVRVRESLARADDRAVAAFRSVDATHTTSGTYAGQVGGALLGQLSGAPRRRKWGRFGSSSSAMRPTTTTPTFSTTTSTRPTPPLRGRSRRSRPISSRPPMACVPRGRVRHYSLDGVDGQDAAPASASIELSLDGVDVPDGDRPSSAPVTSFVWLFCLGSPPMRRASG